MPSSFGGINTASTALRNYQRALETVSHNVANAGTKGYSRQRVEIKSASPLAFFEAKWRQVGQGATLARITRAVDASIDRQARGALGDLNKHNALVAHLSHIEGATIEPSDDGISAVLGAFFDAWSDLGANATSSAARADVRQTGETLANRIGRSYQQIESVREELDVRMQGTVDRIDALAREIASIETAIRESGVDSPNDLLDQRDVLIDEMAALVDVEAVQTDQGLRLFAAGVNVVDIGGSHAFPSTFDPTTGTVSDGTTAYGVRTGELAGLLEAARTTETRMSELDALATGIRDEVNALHSAAGGVDFYQGTGARDLALSDAVAADLDAIVAGAGGSDGDVAHAISGLRDTTFAGLDGRTFHDHLMDGVDALARKLQSSQLAAETDAASFEQASNRREDVRGVSLDEEMTDMLKYQRSYQAAAQALRTLDQMTEELLGMVR